MRNKDSSNSSKSTESDSSAKHSDVSGNSGFYSGHDFDSDYCAKIDASSVYIRPPKYKSKQKPTESSDVTTFVSDQSI